MKCATNAWAKPRDKRMYVSGLKEFDNGYLKSLDYEPLLKAFESAGIIPGGTVQEYVELTKDMPMPIGLANNLFTRSKSKVIRSKHAIRDFGNPAKGFYIAMPNKIDAAGAGVCDKANPNPFQVQFHEPLEEVLIQYKGMTVIPKFYSGIPKSLEYIDWNERAAKQIESSIKTIKTGGASIDLGEVMNVDAYIVDPLNAWTVEFEDELGGYETKQTLAPEVAIGTKIKNLNFMGGGVVYKLPKNYNHTNEVCWDGEFIPTNPPKYLHRETASVNHSNGITHLFKDGSLQQKMSVQELTYLIRDRTLSVEQQYDVSIEFREYPSVPKLVDSLEDGLNAKILDEKMIGVLSTKTVAPLFTKVL